MQSARFTALSHASLAAACRPRAARSLLRSSSSLRGLARVSVAAAAILIAASCRAPARSDAESGPNSGNDTGSAGTDTASPSSGGASEGTPSGASEGTDVTGDLGCERCGGDTCIDLQVDEAHCGACDAACPEHATCTDGECTCGGGLMTCAGACVNVAADPSHCGACDAPCEAGLVCNAGECTEGCGALTECNGGCIDTTSDPLHCGGCGRACGEAQACTDARCSCGADVSYAGDVEPIFVSACTNMGCHRPPALASDLDLTAGAGYDALVGIVSTQCGDRDLVVPGAPTESYLIDKLLGENLCFGSQMPKAGQGIPQADFDTVTSWICGGAAP